MKRVFENQEGTAFLEKCVFPNYELLKQCVKEANPQLEERPEIIVFDKVCRQQRWVGFFSDITEGYHYSNDNMTDLLFTVNTLLRTDFNGILVNTYQDGNDY